MNEQSLYKKCTLTPGQETPVNLTGEFFYVDSADGVFSFAFDEGAFITGRSGIEVNHRPFKNIRFRSDVGAGGATITIYYYAGSVYVTNRNPLVYSRPAPTYMVIYQAVQLVLGATFDIPATNLRTGQPFADFQDHLLIQCRVYSNPAASLEVYKTGDATKTGLLLTVGQWVALETTQALTIRPLPGGADVAYSIMAFYRLPT